MAAEYGFNALPRDPEVILKGHSKESPYIPMSEIAVPDTKVVRAVDEFVKKQLSQETYNHSVRVYYYGMSKNNAILIRQAKQSSETISLNGSILPRSTTCVVFSTISEQRLQISEQQN